MAKCVGDDAFGALTSLSSVFDKSGLFNALRNLGILAMDKMEFWTKLESRNDRVYNAWKYLKRPIQMVEGRILTGDYLIFPSCANVFNFKDGFHTCPQDTHYERCRKYARQTSRLFQSLSSTAFVSDASRASMRTILGNWHKHLGFDIHGNHAEYPDIICPPAYSSGDLFEMVLEVRLWTMTFVPCEDEYGQVSYNKGDAWVGRSAPILTLWERLGYLERFPERRLICVWKEPDTLRAALSGSLKAVYRYVVTRRVPEHLRVCLSALPHVPLHGDPDVDLGDMWSLRSDSESDTSDDDMY